ncbi:MAG: hypothetical protein HDR27_05880 [Lachnospiraceae bacterium]|nr:hypothetical protein [Lachnospiraceae bacterium]
MAESKYTHMKVNNEIELCEVYDKETKEKVKKAFFGAGVSFFIKFKKAAPGRENRFIICVNSSQRGTAKTAILRKVPHAREIVNFFDGSYFMKGDVPPFKRAVIAETTVG